MIEAQIRMRQQELQDDAERMKNKQTAAAPTETVATAHVEEHRDDTGATSTAGACVHFHRLFIVQSEEVSLPFGRVVAHPVCSVDSCERCPRQRRALISSTPFRTTIEEC